MKVEETQPVNGKGRILLAALASVLLASCSTSDSNSVFGFSPNDPASLALVSPSASGANQMVMSSDQSANAFVMDEGDPNLPQDVASLPAMRTGEPAQPIQVQELSSQPESVESIIATASAPTVQPQEPQPAPQVAVVTEPQPVQATQNVAYAEPQPQKRGFFSTLFGPQSASASAKPQPNGTLATRANAPANIQAASKPTIQIATAQPTAARPVASATALPGVRQNSLFEISRRNGMDDDSDVDLYESESDGSYQVASAAGMARLAPNGLMKQTDRVDVACLKPSLVRVLKNIETHYKSKVVVTSGYRSPGHNRKARGARNSLHMYCAAADIQVAGVSKWDLAQFVRTMPGRGGVGTYCHTDSVHVDVGPERDWNWRCRRRK